FDVLVFPDGAVPRAGGSGLRSGASGGGGGGVFRQPAAEEIPAEFRNRLGRVTAEKTVPQLRKFVEAGGTIVTIGGSTRLAEMLGLPIKNGLVEKTPEGQERPLPREKFYVPGSVLRVSIDNTSPVAYGMATSADVF